MLPSRRTPAAFPLFCASLCASNLCAYFQVVTRQVPLSFIRSPTRRVPIHPFPSSRAMVDALGMHSSARRRAAAGCCCSLADVRVLAIPDNAPADGMQQVSSIVIHPGGIGAVGLAPGGDGPPADSMVSGRFTCPGTTPAGRISPGRRHAQGHGALALREGCHVVFVCHSHAYERFVSAGRLCALAYIPSFSVWIDLFSVQTITSTRQIALVQSLHPALIVPRILMVCCLFLFNVETITSTRQAYYYRGNRMQPR
jgi:hypothetical protein